jgi:hypothetical protein
LLGPSSRLFIHTYRAKKTKEKRQKEKRKKNLSP